MDEWKAWERNVFGFLQRHARGAVYLTPSPKTNVTKYNAQIRFMIRLYFCLSKFVDFYPAFARSNAARTRLVFPHTNKPGQPAKEGQGWTQLADSELLRLQRGLLRYEMCCRLVGLPSIAASCNRDVCDEVITDRSHGSVVSQIWVFNPFPAMLPVDEAEEIVCASIYVRDLYESLHWDIFEELGNHILDFNRGRGDGVLEKDDSDPRDTAGYWLSQTEDQVLYFSSSDWTESMSRLGLVFLDRMTRSTVAERRELMRCVFNNILKPDDHRFLWRCWEDVVRVRSTAGRFALGVGPHCNPMIWISSRDSKITRLIDMHGAHRHLRSLGWVFFDDESKLRSLGLPHRDIISDMRDWLEKEANNGWNGFPLMPKILESALDALLTEKELNELVMEKYSLKDHRGDYQAMCQFAAGARAVVDFRSTQLPHID